MQYSIQFVNNSTNSGDFCVFQTPPDMSNSNILSLAWLTKRCHPKNYRLKFTWSIDYNFTWSEVGELIPGVVFDAHQLWPADLVTANHVDFTRYDGAYTFLDQRKGAQAGNLYIHQDDTIPLREASVGIAMGGKASFAVEAQPNLTEVFIPHPTYWVAFGDYVEGQVLDVETITNKAVVEFPPNVYNMTATLGADNAWTITPAKC